MTYREKRRTEETLSRVINAVLETDWGDEAGHTWTLVIQYEDCEVACLSDKTQPATELQSKIFDLLPAGTPVLDLGE